VSAPAHPTRVCAHLAVGRIAQVEQVEQRPSIGIVVVLPAPNV
jgi:hypothetical protein